MSPLGNASVGPVEYTEDDLADSFSHRFGDTHRYTAAWHKWHAFDGRRWREDTTLEVYDRIRLLCRETAAEAESDRDMVALSRASTIAAVERLARADRRHALDAAAWDGDPMLLGTPNGTVDLRTAEVRSPRADDYISRSVAAVPARQPAPNWEKFLRRVTGDDDELRFYLQRLAGYCLTGDIREHALFFVYGTGGNGKGVFLNTLQRLLGEYAVVAAIETFTASKNEQHPTDRAMFRGARLVVSQETEEGRAWAESKIKAMTGGDPITARFMRGDFFTYRPEFKIIIAGNHKPSLKSVDDAMRRRLHLIPFTQTIPERERILDLEDQLAGEWPAILQWAIDGCRLWQENGLRPPAVVRDATAEYFEDQDTLMQWMGERCDTGRNYSAPIAAVFESWVGWCQKNNQHAGSQKKFTEALRGKRIGARKSGDVRYYVGLRVRPALLDKTLHSWGERDAAS